jgi:hypothetical protein
VTDTELPIAGLREEEIESVGGRAGGRDRDRDTGRAGAGQPKPGLAAVGLSVVGVADPDVPEVLLLLPLAWRRPRRWLEQLPRMSDPITATEQQHVRQADDGEEGERDRAAVAS